LRTSGVTLRFLSRYQSGSLRTTLIASHQASRIAFLAARKMVRWSCAS
jgi:hypothetical protein